MKKPIILAAGSMAALISAASADQVFLDDVIVDGSLAVGFDAVNGESFGFDTVRLKENNLRLHFDDTSTSASFPRNDWRLVANDTSNGGANRFSIEDSTAGRTPFTIRAGAPANSLYVDSAGDVGLGNSNPVVPLHITDGNTPTMRLEQDGTSGFTAQTWDVAGNEANFFIRDATNGSKLPFRIRPGAPGSSIDIAAGGNVGLGVQSPLADLHLSRNDGGTTIRMSNTVASTGSDWDTTVTDAGGLLIQKVGQTACYKFAGDGSLSVTKPGGFSGTTVLLGLDVAGNLTTSGTVNGSSDVGRKENFGEIDPSEILEKVASIPVKTWSYKGESVTHVGPMAQDFYKAFELGAGETTISMADADGIAFASIQALHRESREKDQRISELKSANAELEKRLEKIEKLLESQK